MKIDCLDGAMSNDSQVEAIVEKQKREERLNSEGNTLSEYEKYSRPASPLLPWILPRGSPTPNSPPPSKPLDPWTLVVGYIYQDVRPQSAMSNLVQRDTKIPPCLAFIPGNIIKACLDKKILCSSGIRIWEHVSRWARKDHFKQTEFFLRCGIWLRNDWI